MPVSETERGANMAIKDPFGVGQQPNPHAFVQLKGTDICMDFHCECGANCHFDGYFAHVVECPHCHATWQMPFILFPRKWQPEAAGSYPDWVPQMMQPDEDMDEASNG